MRIDSAIDQLDHGFRGRRQVCCLLLLSLFILFSWASVPHAQAEDFYLSLYVGDGSDTNRFRPYCATQDGAAWVDLRPDATKAEGYALCRSRTLATEPGMVPLSKGLEDQLTAKSRTDVAGALKGTFSASAVPQLLKELLVDTGKIRAGKDGKLKIYLGGTLPIYQRTAWVPFEDGGLVADATNYALRLIEPAVAWAASIAEDFNCSDNASLTCVLTWTEFFGTDWAIASNQARVTGLTGVQQKEARADSTLDSDDHWAQATLVSMTADNSGVARCGPIARKANDTTRSFYGFFANMGNNLFTQYETMKRVSGSFTSIANNGIDPVAGEVIRIYVDGSSVSGYVGGVLRVGPTTDTDITGNTYTGIAFSSNNPTTQSCVLDNFSTADIAAPRPNRFAVELP